MGGAKSKAAAYTAPVARTVLHRRQQEAEAMAAMSNATMKKPQHVAAVSANAVKGQDMQKPEVVNAKDSDATTSNQESPSPSIASSASHNNFDSAPLSPDILKEVSKWSVKKIADKVSDIFQWYIYCHTINVPQHAPLGETRVKSTAQIRIELDNVASGEAHESIPKGRMTEIQIREFYKTLR